MFRSFALFFSIGYRYVTLAPALTVVTSLAHRLMVGWLPELTTEAHGRDVVHHRGDCLALYA